MKTPIISLISIALISLAAADIPRKVPLQSYSKLWNDSPFTSKPPPPESVEQKNALGDYALIGVSPIGANSYRVTLINKKTPEERIMVFSGDTKGDFKILGVTRKAGNPLATVVNMQAGSLTGTVSYDEKLLTLTPPAAPPQPQQQQAPGQPPIPGQAPQGVPGQRQPRPRVVPPPATGNATQQQAQPAQQNERPSRRRN